MSMTDEELVAIAEKRYQETVGGNSATATIDDPRGDGGGVAASAGAESSTTSSDVSAEPPSSPSSPSSSPEQTPSAEPAYDPYGNVIEYLKVHAPPELAGKYQSGADVLAGFVNAQKLIGHRDELAQLGKFVQENPYEAYRRLHAQYGSMAEAAPESPAAAAERPADATASAPQIDPALLTQVTRDPQTGRYVDVPGYEGAAAKVNKAIEDFYAHQRAILEDPLKNPRVREYVDSNFVSRRAFEDFLANHERRLATDEAYRTEAILAPKLYVNGNRANGLSHWGNLFVNKLQEANSLGIGYDATTGRVNAAIQNTYASQQADLLYQYGMMMAGQNGQNGQSANGKAAKGPLPMAAAPTTSGRSAPAGGGRSSGDGPKTLDEMLYSRIKEAMDRGEVTQAEVDRWST